jgi:hypothetical protein
MTKIIFKRTVNDLKENLCIENVTKEPYEMLTIVINFWRWDYGCLKINFFSDIYV